MTRPVYGVFDSRGHCLRGGFSHPDPAARFAASAFEFIDDLAVAEICRDHDGSDGEVVQKREGCKACGERPRVGSGYAGIL